MEMKKKLKFFRGRRCDFFAKFFLEIGKYLVLRQRLNIKAVLRQK